jgi:hypothetical protein
MRKYPTGYFKYNVLASSGWHFETFFSSIGCRAIGKLAGIEGTDVYCLRNCFHNDATECPHDECECYGDDDDEAVAVAEKKRQQQQQPVEAVESVGATTVSNDIE